MGCGIEKKHNKKLKCFKFFKNSLDYQRCCLDEQNLLYFCNDFSFNHFN